MQAITAKEARSWCAQDATSLRVTNEDILYYQSENEPGFMIKVPPEHRRIATLVHDLLMLSHPSLFEGGLVWLQQWEIGVSELVRPGWRIVEAMRRAHGDLRSLEIAPAQLFRHDEFVDLHAFLIQVMAYGWGAYFVPSSGGYFLEFRTSNRLLCRAKSAEALEELYTALQEWGPLRDDSKDTQAARD